jgi:hypothetical protein
MGKKLMYSITESLNVVSDGVGLPDMKELSKN